MRLQRRFVTVVAGLAVATASFGACGSDGGGDGEEAPEGSGDVEAAATVVLKATTFDPEEVSVAVGETVLWRWQGGVQHNVRATEGAGFKSKLQSKGQFSHTFDAAGEVSVVCDVHPTTMKGKVVVTE